MILKKIYPLSLAKLQTILLAIVGLLIGIFYVILGKALYRTGQLDAEQQIIFSPWMIIVLPIVYAIMGFITGIIGAGLYNLTANWVGGIKIELK